MADDRIRVGLIGCGHYGRKTQLPNILACDGMKLTALANRSEDSLQKAADTAKQAGEEVKTYRDYQELIADDGVDAVIATLPPGFNLPIVRACEQYGKAVLLEKPIAANDDDLREIETVVERQAIHVQIGMQLLFSEWFRVFKEQVGGLGELLALNEQVYLFDSWAFEPMTWKVDARLSGGMLNSWGVHPLTMLLDLAAGRKADYAELSAFTGSGFAREEADPVLYDTIAATWLTTGGEVDIPCQMQIAMQPDVKDFVWRVEAVCTEGRVAGDLIGREVVVHNRGEEAKPVAVEAFAGAGFDGNLQQLEAFAKCVRDGVKDDRTYQLAVTACLMALEVNVDPMGDE